MNMSSDPLSISPQRPGPRADPKADRRDSMSQGSNLWRLAAHGLGMPTHQGSGQRVKSHDGSIVRVFDSPPTISRAVAPWSLPHANIGKRGRQRGERLCLENQS